MAATENRDPVRDYLSLREELRLHNQELVERPSLVVANKMDLPESEEHLAEFIRKTRKRPVRISALTGQGIDGLKEAIRKLWKRQTSGSRPKRGRPPAPSLHEP
jgi:GTP-binding protein